MVKTNFGLARVRAVFGILTNVPLDPTWRRASS